MNLFVQRPYRPWPYTLGALLALGAPAGRAEDSVTSACRQNPAYCALLTGQEEAAVPTVRGGAEIASIAATLRLLTPELKTRLEQALTDCATGADTEVNRRRLGGRDPSRTQCQEVVPTLDPCGRQVTRAMQWGAEKHVLALECAQGKLDALVPGRFSLEPRYRYDPRTGQTQWLSPQEVRALLRQDCGEDLKGTLVPDVVLHSGNPLEVSAIYDFKFPCPSDNAASWRPYPRGHMYEDLDQGNMYVKALEAEAAIVTRRGIQQRIFP